MAQTNTFTKDIINGETYVYLDSTFYNPNDFEIPINMTFNRNDIFPFKSRNWKLLVSRFDLDSQLFPSYIPYIRKDNAFLPQGYPSAPNYDAVYTTLLGPEGTCPPQNATSLYFELSIHDELGGETYTEGSYLNWYPYTLTPYLNQGLDRQSTINNPYFYSYNSLFIMGLLQDALTDCLSQMMTTLSLIHGWTQFDNLKIRIIKNQDATYSLLLPQQLYNNPTLVSNFNISFNNDLLNILPFDSNPVQSVGFYGQVKYMNLIYIDLYSLNPATFGSNSYFLISTLVGSTYLNPWHTVSLTTINLPVDNQLIDNSEQLTGQLYTQSSKLVTDFLLVTDDPDKLKQVVKYEPQNYVRWIDLRNSGITSYDITPYLNTSDGHNVPVKLKPKTCFSIKLLFRYKE